MKTLKAAERLSSKIHPILVLAGAEYIGPRHTTPSGYEWTLATKYGPLHITCYETWVAMRFENKCDLGGYTGKWNMHINHKRKFPSLEECDWAAIEFKDKLKWVL